MMEDAENHRPSQSEKLEAGLVFHVVPLSIVQDSQENALFLTWRTFSLA